MINLGDKVKNVVDGFEGIAVAKIEYITGCCRFEVQPDKLREGKPIESVWIDTRQLKVTKAQKVKIEKKPLEGSGNAPVTTYPTR